MVCKFIVSWEMLGARVSRDSTATWDTQTESWTKMPNSGCGLQSNPKKQVCTPTNSIRVLTWCFRFGRHCFGQSWSGRDRGLRLWLCLGHGQSQRLGFGTRRTRLRFGTGSRGLAAGAACGAFGRSQGGWRWGLAERTGWSACLGLGISCVGRTPCRQFMSCEHQKRHQHLHQAKYQMYQIKHQHLLLIMSHKESSSAIKIHPALPSTIKGHQSHTSHPRLHWYIQHLLLRITFPGWYDLAKASSLKLLLSGNAVDNIWGNPELMHLKYSSLHIIWNLQLYHITISSLIIITITDGKQWHQPDPTGLAKVHKQHLSASSLAPWSASTSNDISRRMKSRAGAMGWDFNTFQIRFNPINM